MPSTLLIRGLAAASLALCLPAFADDARPEFGIREDQPTTGSMIKRYVVKGAAIPVNKRYAELTAEQKETLNGYYETIGPGDEPPFPAEGLKPIYDAVRKAQNALRVSGDLVLIVTIGPDGEARSVRAIGSPSPEMTKFASSVLLVTRYKPALCASKPCTMDYLFSFAFTLQ